MNSALWRDSISTLPLAVCHQNLLLSFSIHTGSIVYYISSVSNMDNNPSRTFSVTHFLFSLMDRAQACQMTEKGPPVAKSDAVAVKDVTTAWWRALPRSVKTLLAKRICALPLPPKERRVRGGTNGGQNPKPAVISMAVALTPRTLITH